MFVGALGEDRQGGVFAEFGGDYAGIVSGLSPGSAKVGSSNSESDGRVRESLPSDSLL
jgi:hypothetical protein